jgi:hypothetical protein
VDFPRRSHQQGIISPAFTLRLKFFKDDFALLIQKVTLSNPHSLIGSQFSFFGLKKTPYFSITWDCPLCPKRGLKVASARQQPCRLELGKDTRKISYRLKHHVSYVNEEVKCPTFRCLSAHRFRLYHQKALTTLYNIDARACKLLISQQAHGGLYISFVML